MLHTKEHRDLMNQFERDFHYLCIDRESKELWNRKIIYQNGKTNEIFLSYRLGYSFGKATGQERSK